MISCDLDMPIAFDCADKSWALCAVKNEDCLGNSLPEALIGPLTFLQRSAGVRPLRVRWWKQFEFPLQLNQSKAVALSEAAELTVLREILTGELQSEEGGG